jgi:hypothetical protein
MFHFQREPDLGKEFAFNSYFLSDGLQIRTPISSEIFTGAILDPSGRDGHGYGSG